MDWLDAFTTVLEDFQAPTGKRQRELQDRMTAFPAVVTTAKRWRVENITLRWPSKETDVRTPDGRDWVTVAEEPARAAAWGVWDIWGSTVANSMAQAQELQRAADDIVSGLSQPLYRSRRTEGESTQTVLGATSYLPSGDEDREGALGEIKTDARAITGEDEDYGTVASAPRELRDRMAKKDPRYAKLKNAQAVAYSGIIPPLRGLGIGRPMYIHHARFLNSINPRPQILVSDSCYQLGSTSSKAIRTWKSLARDYPSARTRIDSALYEGDDQYCYAVAIT